MILTTNHGSVRELRLNRPPVNALSPELIIALCHALEAAPREGAQALVLSGAPGRFCAGLDVPLLLTLDPPAIAALWHDFYALLRTLASSPIPIAAAITGHAPAGGTVLPLFCDWRVMAEGEWKIGLSEVLVGLGLPPVIFSALGRQVGARQAGRLAVGALLVSPAEALRIGLVEELASTDRVVERAIEWCNGLLALPAHAMALTRQQARADLVQIFDRDLEQELAAVIANWWSDEAQTVLKALAARLGRQTAK
jgi:enoyl-CoA hydratase/carnithine racemase